MSRTTGCLLAACAWLFLARAAAAQVPDDPEDPMPAEVAVAAEVPGIDLDQWIFGQPNGAGTARKSLEAALVQDINRFDARYGLTAAQKKKLEVVGRHEIQRFFDRVEEVKSEYERSKGDWNKVGERVFELQRAKNQPHTDLFGDDSLLVKTLKTILTLEQISRHDKAVYRARVEWMAGLLHSRLVLGADQRRRLVDLVVEETLPLRRYGDFDYDAIMFQISGLPREKLRTVLDENQCRELTLRFAQARRMESLLVSEGYLYRKAPAGAAAGAPKSHHEEARR